MQSLKLFRSNVAAPTSIIFLSISLISAKFEPNFITTPLTPLSLIRVFEPAPRIVTFSLFFCFLLEIQLIVFFYFQV